MFHSLIEIILGCQHSRTTFPLKLKGETTARVTCLDCGKQFEYDWQTMTRGRRVDSNEPIQPCPVEAARVME
jgi:hypothetical protein